MLADWRQNLGMQVAARSFHATAMHIDFGRQAGSERSPQGGVSTARQAKHAPSTAPLSSGRPCSSASMTGALILAVVGWLHRVLAMQVRDFEFNAEKQASQRDSAQQLKQETEEKRSTLEQWSASAYGEVCLRP